jgi:hypothetical protein
MDDESNRAMKEKNQPRYVEKRTAGTRMAKMAGHVL